MLNSVGTCMALFISISHLVIIAIVTFIADNSVFQCEDVISPKFVPIKFTRTHPQTQFHTKKTVFEKLVRDNL